MSKQYQSDIPSGVIEKTIAEYTRQGACIWPKRTACWYQGKIVGERSYTHTGIRIIETPLKEGKKHGMEYFWDDSGNLYSAEPYKDGLPHGTAFQWDSCGNLLGTYTLNRGTGYDLWRSVDEDGTVYVSEIHSLQDGVPHGWEWWMDADQMSVHQERHWHHGILHGIERMWSDGNHLMSGYPKYWIQGVEVSQSEYITETETNPFLPCFEERDQNSLRSFPADLQLLLGKRKGHGKQKADDFCQ